MQLHYNSKKARRRDEIRNEYPFLNTNIFKVIETIWYQLESLKVFIFTSKWITEEIIESC